MTYTGLASGALLWGCMADRVGRRRTLLTALTLAAIFDLMAALMPTFGTFLTARLLGGLGYVTFHFNQKCVTLGSKIVQFMPYSLFLSPTLKKK